MNIKKYVKQHSFETVFTIFDYQTEQLKEAAWPNKRQDYKAIAINLGHTNSKVFDSMWRRECHCLKVKDSLSIYTNGDEIRDAIPHLQEGTQLVYHGVVHTVYGGYIHCCPCNGTGYIEPYDLMITFVRRSDKLWNVSLYSTKPEVDCGAIAKSFGGGGHKGAAGFQCKELPFDY